MCVLASLAADVCSRRVVQMFDGGGVVVVVDVVAELTDAKPVKPD